MHLVSFELLGVVALLKLRKNAYSSLDIASLMWPDQFFVVAENTKINGKGSLATQDYVAVSNKLGIFS